MKQRNPFVTSGYVSGYYFCDRRMESQTLIREVTGGSNLALISTRRMGKTGLIMHCFEQKEIRKKYYTSFIDIYATKSLRELVFMLSKEIVEGLKPAGKKAVHAFWDTVKSLQASLTFDVNGLPSFNLGLGDIESPTVTLDEIFDYLNRADKPCLIAIDEFQQVATYPEGNVEAVLRTYVQHCPNARFIFAGSHRHTMGNIFLSAARPFYQSVSLMHLQSIPLKEYTAFARKHFAEAGKEITPETVETVYSYFDGVTWYMQKVLNTLFDMSAMGETCRKEQVDEAIGQIIDSYQYTYSEILFRLPEKQKELLIAIAKEGSGASNLTSGLFIKKYKLLSSGSVQAALRGLLEKDFVTHEQGVYSIYDQFFSIWLRKKY